MARAGRFDCAFLGVIETKQQIKTEVAQMAGMEGQKAPAFALTGSDGKKHSLADYAGKNIILWFYPKDDTPG
jgi:peroxiredoxin Q/BCP